MIQLEMHKILKRKLVWIVLAGIILLISLKIVGYVRYQYFNQKSHEELWRDVQTFEKHKGVLTDRRLADYFMDYKPLKYNADYMKERWLTDGKPIPVGELFADVDFKIHFGYF